MEETGIPEPREDDDEEVALALEVFRAQWGRGDQPEARRWLRKAIDAAFDAGHDERGVELSKLAAGLNPLSSPPPPSPQVPVAPGPAPVTVPTSPAPAFTPPAPAFTPPAPAFTPPVTVPTSPVTVASSKPGADADGALTTLQAVRVVAARDGGGVVTLRLLDLHAPPREGEMVALLVALAPGAELSTLFKP